MKKPASRIFAVLVALIIGCVFFFLLTFAGDKGRGPLEDLAVSLQTGIARFERNVMGKKGNKSRSAALKWFDPYRKDPNLLRHPDTLLLGAYDNHTTESYESIVALEDTLGIQLPLISFYTAWGSHKEQLFPALRIQTIYDLGSIPLLTWEPWLDDFDPDIFPVENAENKNEEGLKAIATGKYDAYIDKWAQDAKKSGIPIMLRWGHEMNDPYRYPWGPQNNAPEDFIAAWKHVVDRFRDLGIDNVQWMWSPHPAYPPFDIYYPGDDYVDWIGISTLNYGTVASWSQWWTFEEIVDKFYIAVAPYEKPMMATELGSLEIGGDRATWFRDGLGPIHQRFPLMKAVIFFHSSDDNTTTYKSLDWSFRTDKEVTNALRETFDSWKND
ncbi:MAG: cellulase [Saprospirales bacterium]|nr:cellulase [Saprospirales bacterium]